MSLSGSIFIISQGFLLEWCCIYKWKQFYFPPFNCQPCNLNLRFRSQLWDLSFWDMTPATQVRQSCETLTHAASPICPAAFRRVAADVSIMSTANGVAPALPPARCCCCCCWHADLTTSENGLRSRWETWRCVCLGTGLSPLAGPHLPVIPILSKAGETANSSYSAEGQAGVLSLGSQSICGHGEMATHLSPPAYQGGQLTGCD